VEENEILFSAMTDKDRKREETMDSPLLITTKQAARVLGISRSQVYVLLKSGQLESVHIGRSRRITKEQVIDYVRALTNA
jgi:excisionase family DNA binding protein